MARAKRGNPTFLAPQHFTFFFKDHKKSFTPTYTPPNNSTMFEARLTQGKVFKQLIEALKDLVQEANIDCSDDEISIQAMDNSHVSLVAVSLRSGGFDHFRCDRPISLGFNAANMGKILKCAGNDDIITLKAEDEGDALTMMFESPNGDRIADFGELYMSCWQRYGGSMKGWCMQRGAIVTSI
eukprot:scaffold7216_cov160-Skeletonema_marinoi.AAC.3